MKSLKPILTLTVLLLLLSSIQISAQHTRELRPLEASDFKCLQSLECIRGSESLKVKGWSFVFDDTVEKFAQELTAKMEGENISFFAVYDKEGDLIKSVYTRKNVALPANLLSYLAENNDKGWKLAGTEMIMNNFDESTIVYNVELENHTISESRNYDLAYINDIILDKKELAEN